MEKLQGYDNEWYKVPQKMTCCDCGLSHSMKWLVEFKKGKAIIYFKAKRLKKKI